MTNISPFLVEDIAQALMRGDKSPCGAARKILQAIESNGFAIVPVEPTEAMVTTGAMIGEWHRGNLPNATDVYKAMLTAYKEGK